jgi:hypothetical protein
MRRYLNVSLRTVRKAVRVLKTICCNASVSDRLEGLQVLALLPDHLEVRVH